MTHTSPEREELRLLDDLATVLWAKRVEIAAARLKPQPSGELTRASAHGLASEVFAWMHRVGYRRLPIDQALEDTKVVAPAGAPSWLPDALRLLDVADEALDHDTAEQVLGFGFDPPPDADCVIKFSTRAKINALFMLLDKQRPSPPHNGAHAVADTATPAIAGRVTQFTDAMGVEAEKLLKQLGRTSEDGNYHDADAMAVIEFAHKVQALSAYPRTAEGEV